MTVPLFILGVLSVYFGNLAKEFFVGLGAQSFGNSIFIHPNHIILTDTEFGVPPIMKLLPFILNIIFIILAIYIFEKKSIFIYSFFNYVFGRNFYRFFNQRY